MSEVNGAHNLDRYGKNWLKNLRVLSNVKSFCYARCPASQTNTTHYIDPYDTHMDQKSVLKVAEYIRHEVQEAL